MNLGLSDMLKSEFKNFIPIERPKFKTASIPDPNWLAGFVSGEGNFDVNITASTYKIDYSLPSLSPSCEARGGICKYLGSGKIYKYPNKSAVSLTIVKLSDIINIVIPIFNKNSLFGVKLFDSLDWC